MKKLFLLVALFIAAAFPSCSKHDGVETPDLPDPQPLAIVFAEGNSLQFDVDETKTVHYTITGGGANNVVKAEMQNPDDAYALSTTQTSATEGTIKITAKTPTDNCVLVSVSNSLQTVTMVIVVSSKPSSQELAITFAEGNSLEFDVGETKTVHYTITGGSANNVVKVEMQNPDGAYALSMTPTSATEGTITITAKTPTDNCVIVTVSDGSQTIMAPIDVTVILKASFDGKTVAVETPGTLRKLLADYDETTITELTVIGNLNDEDISTLKNLPNLAVLDMEHVNLEELRGYAFYGKKSLTSVKLPLTMKTIGSYAFSYCSSLTSITIPDSVTSIGNEAFDGCSSLTSITIPDSVTTIGDGAFFYCSSLTGVYITDIAKWCAIEFKTSSSNPLYACNLYLNGELVTELVIPDNVTSIGSYAFRGCSSLTSITIPDSVTSIGSLAFEDCSSLTSVTIGNGVTSIGFSAFCGCSSLTSITIPDGVTSIGNYAFYNCSSLTSITIPDGVTSIGTGAFRGCSSLTSITIPDGVTSIWNEAFRDCGSLTSVTIGNGVTSIGSHAFYDCRSLTSITIPDGVTTIGDYTFYGCRSLTSITIPNSVTEIGDRAFFGCSGLTSITIPDSVTTIGSWAFSYCSDLTSITIPDGVTTIGDYTFYGCRSLTSITIPNSVTEIGERAFSGCRSLTSIYCKAQTPPTIGFAAFNGVPTTTILLYVPIGSADAYRAADDWKSFSKTNEMEFE